MSYEAHHRTREAGAPLGIRGVQPSRVRTVTATVRVSLLSRMRGVACAVWVSPMQRFVATFAS